MIGQPQRQHGCWYLHLCFLTLATLALDISLLYLLDTRLLVVVDPLQPADAVIPLAGGVERAEYAARLHQDGYAPWFVATDVEQILDLGEARPADTPIARLALEQGVAQQHILTTAAPVTSTYTEALAVRDLAQREGWKSLIVVTSPTHTRRSRAIFRTVFTGTDIAVSIRPAINEEETDEPVARS